MATSIIEQPMIYPENGKLCVRTATISITIPAGTQASPTTMDVDVSDYLPSGAQSPWGAFGLITYNSVTYTLTYINASNGEVSTWISRIRNKQVQITNTTSAWANATLYLMLFTIV